MSKNTLIVNMFGGPGAGKSSCAMELTAHLKWNEINAEYVSEYAKDLVWDKRFSTFNNQIYIFAKQHNFIFKLLGQVDVVITDSPVILGSIYNESHKHFNDIMFNEFNTFNNLNFYLKRTKGYLEVGRYQTEREALVIDDKVKIMLDTHKIDYKEIWAQEGVSRDMAKLIKVELERLNNGRL